MSGFMLGEVVKPGDGLHPPKREGSYPSCDQQAPAARTSYDQHAPLTLAASPDLWPTS